METARLGRTELRVSRVAFGCAPIGGHDYGRVDDNQSIRTVRSALEQGVSFFDVADVYGLGHAEEVLGRALEGRREQAFIATKVGMAFDAQGHTRRDLSPAWMRAALEGSLRRLRTEVIDLYQVHWPDPNVPIEDTFETLLAFQKAGKVRHLGVCNFPPDLVEKAMRLARLETIQVSYNLADWQDSEAIRSVTEAHGLTPLAYNCLAQGLLTGKYDETSVFHGSDRRQRSEYFRGPKLAALLDAVGRMKRVREEYRRSLAELAIRWVLDSWSNSVAIVGLKGEEQLADAAGAVGWGLRAADVDALRDRTCPGHVST